ncbi:hypothetical protein CI109_102872 [Kwoniella shandongensis]|uniref:Nucleolar protein 12 n=1 Tax=Kwoniella shandongensis TaxID=1734106 RepID=A0A5M6C822_9TREE|nr:uncharacterized protein CI109_000062 [Kwoniella shandongensis]KAA5531224.1 hypothetical protein CI109_000062 [Kwoniella shandongensis]
MSATAALTKKQQKALAFRSKQKAKKAGQEAPPDLPEEDEVVPDDDEKTVSVNVSGPSKEKSKKEGEGDAGEEDEGAATKKDGESTKDKGKKRKTAWDEEEEGEGEAGKGKKGRKDAKQRFILFVGNLGFKTTREEVQKHFEPAIGKQPAVRLLTTRPNTPAQAPKSRGIAFLELSSSADMQACLKLHHSNLKGRDINVELTAGGGGGGEERKRKIDERNKRVGTQRERKAEKEKEEGGGGGDVGDEGQGAGAGADGEKVKVRGGRRVRNKTKGADDSSAPPAKRARSDGDANPGWSNRQPSSRPQDGRGGRSDQGPPRFQKKKWQPTGANALTVG